MNPHILTLLTQIIEVEQSKDDSVKKASIEKFGSFGEISGEPFTLHHLKLLKDLIVKEIDDQNNKIPCISIESEEQ